MSVIEGIERTDPNYIKRLEDEFCQLKAAAAAGGHDVKVKTEGDDMAKVLSSLDQITDLLGKIELSQNESVDRLDKIESSYDSTRATAATKAPAGDVGLSAAQHLMQTGGDLKSYICHMRYATEMLHTRQFYDCGATKYDRMIVDKYLERKGSSFDPDPVISSLTFASKVIPDSVELCHGASLTKGVVSYQQSKGPRNKRRNSNVTRKQDDTPIDFPPEICFQFNYRQCQDENCPKAHSCRKCGGRHRADTCKEKTRRA